MINKCFLYISIDIITCLQCYLQKSSDWVQKVTSETEDFFLFTINICDNNFWNNVNAKDINSEIYCA